MAQATASILDSTNTDHKFNTSVSVAVCQKADSCNAAIGASVTKKCVALGVHLRPRKSNHEARFVFDEGHWPLLLHAARDAKYTTVACLVQAHAMMEI